VKLATARVKTTVEPGMKMSSVWAVMNVERSNVIALLSSGVKNTLEVED